MPDGGHRGGEVRGMGKIIVPWADKLAYSYEEAGAIVGVSANTLRKENRAGRLQTIRVAGRVLITRSRLIEYLESMGETGRDWDSLLNGS